MTDKEIHEKVYGTEQEYAEAFYAWLKTDLEQAQKDALQPLIAQAHQKGIATLDLVEIVQSSMIG